MSVSDATPERAAGAVAAVNLKLPPYWPTDPDLWFAQVEAQFATRGITTQKTKYEYLVASLPPEYATQVRDLILHAPETTPYDTLKQQLIARTAIPQQRRLHQLFHSTELGDQRPTQLLRRMQQLLGHDATSADSTLLRELFLQRLPANVRIVLASSGVDKTLQELAELGDRVIAAASPAIAGIAPSQPTEIEKLRSEIAQLRETVSAVSSPAPRQMPRQQSPYRASRPRSPSPHRQPRLHSPPPSQRSHVCWYHARFGNRARKCTPPCSYSGNERAST